MKTFEELASFVGLIQESPPDRLLEAVDKFKRNFENIKKQAEEFYYENSNSTP